MATRSLTNLAQLRKVAEAAEQKLASKAALAAVQEQVDAIDIPTEVSAFTNDADYQNGTQVTEQINAKISSAYKAAGSCRFAELPPADAANLGKVFNIEDAFTTTTEFVDGPGWKFDAGTNVAIVEGKDGGYAYDVMAGFVDTSHLVEKVPGKGLSTNDFTTEDKQKLEGIGVATDAEVDAMLQEVFG